MVVARRGRAGTTVPDTAASYTQPRGPNPRTTARGGRKRRERGHGCTRHHDIIHSTEREGGLGGVIDRCARPNPPQLTSKVMIYHGCCWQGFVREKARLRQ